MGLFDFFKPKKVEKFVREETSKTSLEVSLDNCKNNTEHENSTRAPEPIPDFNNFAFLYLPALINVTWNTLKNNPTYPWSFNLDIFWRYMKNTDKIAFLIGEEYGINLEWNYFNTETLKISEYDIIIYSFPQSNPPKYGKFSALIYNTENWNYYIQEKHGDGWMLMSNNLKQIIPVGMSPEAVTKDKFLDLLKYQLKL